MAGDVGVEAVNVTGDYRVLIRSVGSARPSSSAAIAQGLGLPAKKIVSCLYRAPSVLMEGVNQKVAQNMVSLLSEIGYQVEAQKNTEPLPEVAILYDVAIYIEDAQRVENIIESLSFFIGMSTDEAAKMIMMPPGIVLGLVSEATINSFIKHIGEGVSISTSHPETARYHFFYKIRPILFAKECWMIYVMQAITLNGLLRRHMRSAVEILFGDVWKPEKALKHVLPK